MRRSQQRSPAYSQVMAPARVLAVALAAAYVEGCSALNYYKGELVGSQQAAAYASRPGIWPHELPYRCGLTHVRVWLGGPQWGWGLFSRLCE